MLKFVQILLCYALLLTILVTVGEARPSGETGPESDALETQDSDDVRSAYGYEMPAQAIYPNIPLDRLQMLYAQYRPSYNGYLRSPSYGNMNELYRLPESKRQVRYRQCYFNPISCFRK
ncbi:uncharacterized protein LOC115631790 [Scaptodrosophila lebanonensis]|uniref:Uncharacterized protein LOC115631790 n=1 Tax=Drosophila lebanonensis TaxID=7225 RepID=A0A6J2U920_DROLE|nr:uncharacterized protein LOC115631790 [Scaptodrosophila lebanonensis]